MFDAGFPLQIDSTSNLWDIFIWYQQIGKKADYNGFRVGMQSPVGAAYL